MLLILVLILIAWLAIAVALLCLCRAAADGEAPHARRTKPSSYIAIEDLGIEEDPFAMALELAGVRAPRRLRVRGDR